MSIVAIRSTDTYNWLYHGMVANASGPGGYPTSIFGPDENDVAVLGDGKTLLCVIRMDGDAGCATKSYRYYAAIYSHDFGKSWGRAVRACSTAAIRFCLLAFAACTVTPALLGTHACVRACVRACRCRSPVPAAPGPGCSNLPAARWSSPAAGSASRTRMISRSG